MDLLDFLLRGGAIGTFFTIAAVLLVRGNNLRLGLPVAVFALMAACYLLISAPGTHFSDGFVFRVLILGAISAPLGFTWMILELLAGPQERHWPWLVLAVAVVMTGLLGLNWPLAVVARGVLAAVLYAGLLVVSVRSDRDDLVSARRRFRRGFLAAMTSLGVAITLVELMVSENQLPTFIYPLQAGAFWVLALLFALQALTPETGVIPAAVSPRPTSKPQPGPQRSDLITRLEAAMEDGAWQRESLTIGQLAKDLGAPEHRLRAAINRELGYRNFSTFINQRRIEAAKTALTDPSRGGTTILEIAYETGFASLGPFNRAFRAMTGQSPREYRAAHTGAG